ncbi:putative lipid II flippase FtsW [Salisediminibacterium beveridgei]|uniref:putative lipid II flippase FtsW n=1 Tax=Salisediminibacterium beveridgei TaxID=632773 RepID=UPI000A015B63|nr:putative lipid II flippase FtsW [Salisediminibacterium beveridgei]
MKSTEKKPFFMDWYLLVGTLLMGIFGLVMIYSASYVRGYDMYGNLTHFFDRQLQWLLISVILLSFFMFFPYRRFAGMMKLLVLGSMFLLILVLIPGVGVEVNHATRWIDVPGLGRIQPSEFVKLASILYLAHVYSRKQSYINQFWKGIFPPLVIIGGFFFLILQQPDLGTAVSIIGVAVIIAFTSGARIMHLTGLAAVVIVVVTYYARSEEYRMSRITGFMRPFELEQTQGFQVVQSYIAIAHGGLTGTGLGQSVQKLFYLPEAHTDFILAIVSEELGVLGIGFALLVMLIIISRGIMIGIRCRDSFGSLLAYGISFQLAIQVVFNAGAVSGLLPITGIPFPFLSYGGSSLMVTFVMMGILINISRKMQQDHYFAESGQRPEEAVLSFEEEDVKRTDSVR